MSVLGQSLAVCSLFLPSQMPYKWIRLAFLVIFCGLELALTIYQRYFSNVKQHVSYAGHAVRLWVFALFFFSS